MVDDKQPVSGAWREPLPDEGPIKGESWFVPEGADAVSGTPSPEADRPADDVPPGIMPERAGSWFTPIDAQLDALLSGADDTIVEIHESEEAVAPAPWIGDQTQPQAVADTQALKAEQGWVVPASTTDEPGDHDAAVSGEEPGASDAEEGVETVLVESQPAEGSTPIAEDTPAQPGLSPAEQALLEEERAAQVSQENSMVQQPQRPAQPSTESDIHPVPEPSPFEQVEQKVAVLRQRFEAGYLTREQLQNELRGMMILDDNGHWWMLGLETNRWYYYDGKDWVAATPPGYEERVRGSAVRTATGMQEVVVDEEQFTPFAVDIELDEDGMPLPQRVPQDDPGATLVSQNAAFMEPVRPSDAPTQSRSRQVEADAAGYVAHPAGRDMPMRPGEVSTGDQTIRASAVSDVTMQSASVPGAIPVPQQATMPVSAASAAARQQAQQPGEPPKRYRLGEYPQPDYSTALGAARNRNTYLRWTVRAVVISIIGGMFLTLVLLLGMIGYYLYEVERYSEAVASLTERAANFENTLILDSNGAVLAEFSNPDAGLRTVVPLNQISPWLIHATVATENETFYTDPGFSVLAIVRAAVQNVQAGDTVSGASTITQQLARALVLETEFASQRTTERKIVEIIVASEIKRNYDKNEILEIYLNEIFYGNFAYGVEAAARTYFNKTAAELNPAEAAFLAGLPQWPARYDPVVNREAALRRMHDVLRLMADANNTGCIYIEHNDTTMWGVPSGNGLCVRADPQSDGSTIYYYKTSSTAEWTEMTLEIAMVEIAQFSRPAVEFTHPHFVNYVWQQLEAEFGPQRIYSVGFRVTTTLNETIQSAAEQSVVNSLTSLRARGYPIDNGSVVVMRPDDGAVLAMVGSADYHNEEIDGQVNVAFTGQQPGSSIKPFVYLAAFEPNEQGQYLTPASVLWDVYSDFSGYVPVNYDRLYHGPRTARLALGNSYNVPAVKVLQFVGVERFTSFAQRVGLRFPLGNPVERNAGLPTALGAVEVRLFDMVAAFSMLANNGRRVEPYAIVSITDNDGNPVAWTGPNPEGLKVVEPEYAYLITSILSDNEARAAAFGYGPPLELSGGRIAAVKTGTSNDSRDNWTLGYTPQITVGVWVGNTDNSPIYGLSGVSGAAEIWNEVMEVAHAGLPVAQFTRPANIIDVEVCNDSGVQAFQGCAGQTHWEVFAASAPPRGPEGHTFVTLQVDDFSGKLVNEYCNDMPVIQTYLNVDDPSAVAWLSTAEGQSWIAARNVQVATVLPPTEYCSPNEPRPTIVISSPPDNFTASGTLPVQGAVSLPGFVRYEILIAPSHNPQSFDELVAMQTAPQPNPNSLLGQIDTSRYPNGPYTIRVIAFDDQGRDVRRDIPIMIDNGLAPPVVPAFIPTPTLAPTLTSVFSEPVATQPASDPNIVPMITPTWTLSPVP